MWPSGETIGPWVESWVFEPRFLARATVSAPAPYSKSGGLCGVSSPSDDTKQTDKQTNKRTNRQERKKQTNKQKNAVPCATRVDTSKNPRLQKKDIPGLGSNLLLSHRIEWWTQCLVLRMRPPPSISPKRSKKHAVSCAWYKCEHIKQTIHASGKKSVILAKICSRNLPTL